MAIPTFQELMLPLLQLLSDGHVHSYSGIVATLEDRFLLTEEERQVASEKTGARIFENRVGWAGTHLKTAGFISRPARVSMQITDAGMNVLASKLEAISSRFLREHSQAYRDYYSAKSKDPDVVSITSQLEEDDSLTPEELIERGYSLLSTALKSQIKEHLAVIDPFHLERLVIKLLKQMGYGGSEADMHKALAMRRDGGVDGWVKEDKLGLNTLYIQAKRYQDNVQRPDLQKFVGALEERHSAKGIFITTSSFSPGVFEYLQKIRHQVILIDGDSLVNLMFENNVGVKPTGQAFVMKVLDPSVFIPDQTI